MDPSGSIDRYGRDGRAVRRLPRTGRVPITRRDRLDGTVFAPAGSSRQVLVLEYDLQTPPFPLDARVARLVSQLDIDPHAVGRSHELATATTETGVTDVTQPAGVAAACVYMATRETSQSTLTQAQCAEAASTTPTTLRERWQELKRVTADDAAVADASAD